MFGGDRRSGRPFRLVEVSADHRFGAASRPARSELILRVAMRAAPSDDHRAKGLSDSRHENLRMSIVAANGIPVVSNATFGTCPYGLALMPTAGRRRRSVAAAVRETRRTGVSLLAAKKSTGMPAMGRPAHAADKRLTI